MLRIDTSWVEAVATAARASDLYPSLQGAIALEHATIPVYLSALFSLKPGAMPACARSSPPSPGRRCSTWRLRPMCSMRSAARRR